VQASSTSNASSTAVKKADESLISRFKLESRIAESNSRAVNLEQAAGKATWESSAQEREKSLQERKAQMILAARK
jgi:coupling of ubiquitin conjugation to ER degradation protein 1